MINAIRQADPVDWKNDFSGQNIRKIKIVNVQLNGFDDSGNDVRLFSDLNSKDAAKDYFKEKEKNGELLFAPEKTIEKDGKKIPVVVKFTGPEEYDYEVTSQLIYNMGHNQITPVNAQLTLDATQKISENSGDEIVIFYVHCTQGKDRTGVQSVTYLVNQYMQANGGHINKQALTNLISEGFVRWDGDDALPVNGYNAGKKIYSSSFYETLANSETAEDERIFPNVFSELTASEWNSVVPRDQKDLIDPEIDQYGFTLPLCKSGFTSSENSRCLDFSSNRVSWQESDVNLGSDLSKYNFYIADMNSKGLPVKITEVAAPNYINGKASLSLTNEEYPAVKIYITGKDGAPVSSEDKTKYQFVSEVA